MTWQMSPTRRREVYLKTIRSFFFFKRTLRLVVYWNDDVDLGYGFLNDDMKVGHPFIVSHHSLALSGWRRMTYDELAKEAFKAVGAQ